MQKLTIRRFTPVDVPAITSLQKAYQQAYPHATVVPGEIYLSPGFEEGRNIFCALDESGQMLGYAPLYPVLTQSPGLAHTVWAEVKALPEAQNFLEVKEALFEAAARRAQEAGTAVPGHGVQLTFQYHPSETASIAFVQAHGCAYTESLFRLMRDLADALPTLQPPEGIEVRRWHLDSETEQAAYVAARNEAFPATPLALADWQCFLASPAWKEGTNLAAFDGAEVIGCVTAYWDEALVQASGRQAGYTEYIFVREKWRGHGIAACLITQALRYLQDCGREAAFLEVKASNENALGLYTRLGYKKVDETRFYARVL
jgi:ribosomal protein S18 acetylase RimI-like enzyme